MSDHPLRPRRLVAATLVIGGGLIAAFPGYLQTLVQLILATLAAGAALHALASRVPPTGWISPFTWMSPFGRAVRRERRGRGSDELASIRSKLTGWRRPMPGGPPIPPETQALLRSLVLSALEQRSGEGAPHPFPATLSPLTRAVLGDDIARQSHWIDSRMPNRHETAEVVHRVLDDLERMIGPFDDSRGPKGDLPS